GIEPARVDDTQPQLSLVPTRPGALQVRGDCALKPLLRKWPRMTEKAETDLPVPDNRPAAHGVAPGAGQRLRDRVADHRVGLQRCLRRGGDGGGGECAQANAEPVQPNTSCVIVPYQSSAWRASAARTDASAVTGLVPPAPSISMN